MSKSLGNFFTVRELLEKGWPGEAIRLVLLGTHYRQPIDFTDAALAQSKARLDRWYRALDRIEKLEPTKTDVDATLEQKFTDALWDDLNTPLAMSVLDDQATHILAAETKDLDPLGAAFRRNAAQLGFLAGGAARWFKGEIGTSDEREIEALIAERNAARKAKRFADADRVRDDLKAKGIELEDGSEGTTWKRIK